MGGCSWFRTAQQQADIAASNAPPTSRPMARPQHAFHPAPPERGALTFCGVSLPLQLNISSTKSYLAWMKFFFL